MTETKRQHTRRRRMLAFIARFVREHGFPPSRRQIMRGCGYASTCTVNSDLNALAAQGCIERGDPRTARSIRLVKHTGRAA
jgi:SOS-response transcriptional repressor LexA